jgi:hypothetical protein
MGKIQRDDTRKAIQREMWDLDERGYRRRERGILGRGPE